MTSFQSPSLFPDLRKPYIFAHQGGEHLAPTNTLAAFAVADALGGVDFLDIDVHMTRDGHLVGIHDSTVDSTTNGHGRVDSFTSVELQQLDAGYWFRDLQGEYSYRGKGVHINERGLNLKKRSLIECAHGAGQELYYWTVDDVPTMRELIRLGADGLFTNRPDLLKALLQELKLRA